MIKTCQYYWDKVALLSFQDRFKDLNSMLEEAEDSKKCFKNSENWEILEE